MLKYYNYDIVFQEVPDEVSLAINITNCPVKCRACHSPHLCENIGGELNSKVLSDIVSQYDKAVTCVCLMGGDGDRASVAKAAKYIRESLHKKVAWYSGRNEMPSDLTDFDYVKLGGYDMSRGGLSSESTNQRMYRIDAGKPVDITDRFWKRKNIV